MRLISILPLICVFLLFPVPQRIVASPMPFGQRMSSRAEQSVAPINDENGTHFCSASSINESQRYFLTAAHCIIDHEPYMFGHLVSVVWMDVEQDLAVVSASQGRPALKLAQQSPRVGEEVEIIGYPYGLERISSRALIKLLWQKVDNEADKTIFVGIGVAPGNSGGPILLRGRLVSVLQLGWPKGAVIAGTPWSVLARAIRPYVE
jgi:hypothetical protein